MEYKFVINDFEGPLDLLLHLIKESKMNIMEIEIVSLTNQYVSFIDSMKEMNLVVASEYLSLASELIYLKSKCLLPQKEEGLEEDEEYVEAKENLVNRLLEYQKYKEMTGTFKELEEKRKEVFTKVPSSLKEYAASEIRLGQDISLDDLLQAFSKYLERKRYLDPVTTKITGKEISIEERTKSIRKILKDKKRVEFFELFEDFSKPYVVATFLSIFLSNTCNSFSTILTISFE